MSARPEDIVHKAILVWIRQHTPCTVWHTPNGGSRHPIEAKNLKDLGVRSGVADLFILPPGGLAHFIEVKRPKGGTVSPEQRAFQREVEDKGARYGIARSKNDAIDLFRLWNLPFSETLWSGARAA